MSGTIVHLKGDLDGEEDIEVDTTYSDASRRYNAAMRDGRTAVEFRRDGGRVLVPTDEIKYIEEVSDGAPTGGY